MPDTGNGVIEAEEHVDDDYVERGTESVVRWTPLLLVA